MADLHGMHVVLRSQLVERPLAADRLSATLALNFGLCCFRVVVIALSLSRPPTPKLTYCVVQILGTIIVNPKFSQVSHRTSGAFGKVGKARCGATTQRPESLQFNIRNRLRRRSLRFGALPEKPCRYCC